MQSKDNREQRAPAPSDPKRRFRLQKLEDRIAPKKGGNTKRCQTDSCDGGSTGTSSY